MKRIFAVHKMPRGAVEMRLMVSRRFRLRMWLGIKLAKMAQWCVSGNLEIVEKEA